MPENLNLNTIIAIVSVVVVIIGIFIFLKRNTQNKSESAQLEENKNLEPSEEGTKKKSSIVVNEKTPQKRRGDKSLFLVDYLNQEDYSDVLLIRSSVPRLMRMSWKRWKKPC